MIMNYETLYKLNNYTFILRFVLKLYIQHPNKIILAAVHVF